MCRHINSTKSSFKTQWLVFSANLRYGIKPSHSAQMALIQSQQHVTGERASSSLGGWRWGWWRWMGRKADRWAIDLPQRISPAPFTEPITSPADWCVDNWAVAVVSMFLLQPDSDTSYCIVFYFNTIYNKGHPDAYLCQYPSRLLSTWWRGTASAVIDHWSVRVN